MTQREQLKNLNQIGRWPIVNDPEPADRYVSGFALAVVVGLIVWALVFFGLTGLANAAGPKPYKLTQITESQTRPELTIFVIQTKAKGSLMRIKDCYTPSVLAESIPLKKGVNIWFAQTGFVQCLQFETWQRKKSKVSVTRWDGY